MYSLKQLEYLKYLGILAENCSSTPAKEKAGKLHPFNEISIIREKLRLRAEFLNLIEDFRFRFDEVTNISHLFEEYIYTIYDHKDLKKIYHNVRTGNSLKKALLDYSHLELISKMNTKITLLDEIERRYNEIFDADGEIKDSASPLLRSIRKKNTYLRKTISVQVEKKIEELGKNNFLFEKYATTRNGRFVIPIKEGSIPFVSGMVHGRSSSKSTVYVEPTEIVGLNNDLELNKNEELQEINKILLTFTGQIQQKATEIKDNTTLLVDFDLNFAIAFLSQSLGATIPVIIDEPKIELYEARHPLLISQFGNIEKVIPFDLNLGDKHRILILSGPNTGGKTVTLKTVGFLSLLASTGLPITAKSGSKIGIFQHILADIGDEQSLENSLSTFSSHVHKISKMLAIGDENSLILIDEIGAATDPEQGSALAQAILELLVDKNVTGVITTHYSALKVFAETDERCVNASMQFDTEKQTPTFKFRTGIPGNSFAIEVAEKLGFDEDLIKRAKSLAGVQNIEFTRVLKEMSKERKSLSKQLYEYQLKNSLLKQKIAEYEQKIVKIDEEEKLIRKKTLDEARRYLNEIHREINESLADIKHLEKKEKKYKLLEKSKKIEQISTKIKEEFQSMTTKEMVSISKPQIGQKVWIKDIETEGEIIAIENDNIKVDLGEISYTTNKNNIFSLKTNTDTNKGTKVFTRYKPKEVKIELKILGLTFDEALPKIRDFIDDAVYADLGKIRIVHGKGTGALRRKVRNYLRKDKRIKTFSSPEAHSGGDGVTEIELSG